MLMQKIWFSLLFNNIYALYFKAHYVKDDNVRLHKAQESVHYLCLEVLNELFIFSRPIGREG